MGVSRHEIVPFVIGALDKDADEPTDTLIDGFDFSQEPETKVGRDLIVARASSVKLSAQRANNLAQAALVRSVDVLVVRLDSKLGGF